MHKFNPYRLLELPAVYSFSQWLLLPGSKTLLSKHYSRIFGDPVDGLVLDVGCGPELTTPNIAGTLVGCDLNGKYIREYTRRLLDADTAALDASPPAHPRIGCVGSADRLPFRNALFREARCMGLFHHMDDDTVACSVREMLRCTQPGGRVVILDNVWPRRWWTRPQAWLIRRLDRGSWVRSEQELRQTVERACPGSWQTSRFTYTLNGLELLCLTLVKNGVAENG